MSVTIQGQGAPTEAQKLEFASVMGLQRVLTGNVAQVVGFDSEGKLVAVNLNWSQLVNEPTPPSYPVGILSVSEGISSFLEADSLEATPGTVVIRDQETGAIKTANPVDPEDAVNRQYLNTLLGNKLNIIGETQLSVYDEVFSPDDSPTVILRGGNFVGGEEPGLVFPDGVYESVLKRNPVSQSGNIDITLPESNGVLPVVTEAGLEIANGLPTILFGSTPPNNGEYLQGSFVYNTNVVVNTNSILFGWSRLTTGNTHELDVDWVVVYLPTVQP